MPQYKAVFFDWDGTVADTRPGIFNSVRYAITEHGVPDRPDDELTWFIGPPLYEGFEHVFGVSPEMAVTLTDTYRVYYRKQGIYECDLYDGIRDLMLALRARGVRTGIVSSKPQVFLETLTDYLDLREAVDVIVGPELSNHISDKSVLVERALSESGVAPEEAAMVGDRMFDMAGAKKVGVTAVGILFGYGDAEELKASGADVICETPADLAAYFLS